MKADIAKSTTQTIETKRKRQDVALALKASLPGLVNAEAWPWLTMADAAIKAFTK